jgi:SAM-dependent methyltransferase
MTFDIHHSECVAFMKTLPDNSIDAIVTDPPYGLSFMGKRWDYDVPSEDVWKECLRVLKPGGHLLAFAGTRTQHRMAVRIEDAGFEIRDMIAWVYGSGFPKSLDVSKAIDKIDASEEQERRRLRFTAWVRSTGITSRQIDEATGTNMGGHYTTAASQPAIMTREHLEQCRPLLGNVPEWVEREADIRSVESKNFAEREVVGSVIKGSSPLPNNHEGRWNDGQSDGTFNITAPATPAAKQWQGWGTALKPALEPITVARKPLVGTVAQNVLEHGTGALNIDGCRVEGADKSKFPAGTISATEAVFGGGAGRYADRARTEDANPQGRFPANLIHDGSDEVVGLFPEAAPAKAAHRGTGKGKSNAYGVYGGESTVRGHDDAGGSAARFFYCAKASKRDRDEGCEGMDVQHVTCRPESDSTEDMGLKERLHGRKARNHHPTVKPTDLMRYLCRLVTPPNGTVLDPFMGSGSTGKAAVLEGFSFIGCDMTAEYVDIARARITHAFNSQPNKLDL